MIILFSVSIRQHQFSLLLTENQFILACHCWEVDSVVQYLVTGCVLIVYVFSQQLKPTTRSWFSARVVAGAGYSNDLAGVYGYWLCYLSSAKGVMQGTFI